MIIKFKSTYYFCNHTEIIKSFPTSKKPIDVENMFFSKEKILSKTFKQPPIGELTENNGEVYEVRSNKPEMIRKEKKYIEEAPMNQNHKFVRTSDNVKFYPETYDDIQMRDNQDIEKSHRKKHRPSEHPEHKSGIKRHKESSSSSNREGKISHEKRKHKYDSKPKQNKYADLITYDNVPCSENLTDEEEIKSITPSMIEQFMRNNMKIIPSVEKYKTKVFNFNHNNENNRKEKIFAINLEDTSDNVTIQELTTNESSIDEESRELHNSSEPSKPHAINEQVNVIYIFETELTDLLPGQTICLEKGKIISCSVFDIPHGVILSKTFEVRYDDQTENSVSTNYYKVGMIGKFEIKKNQSVDSRWIQLESMDNITYYFLR